MTKKSWLGTRFSFFYEGGPIAAQIERAKLRQAEAATLTSIPARFDVDYILYSEEDCNLNVGKTTSREVIDDVKPLNSTKQFQVCTRVLDGVWTFLVSFLSWIRMVWMVRKLPGPPSSFFLGHSFIFSEHRPLDFLVTWKDEFKFHKFHLYFLPTVIVYSPELVEKVLSSRERHNDKGQFYHGSSSLLGDGVVIVNGSKWLRRRKMLTPAFHLQILERYFEIFKENAKKFIATLESCGMTEDYINICPYSKKLAMQNICETAMGVFLGSDKDKVEEISKISIRLETIWSIRIGHPWLLIDPIFRMNKLYKEDFMLKNKLHSFTSFLISKRKAELKKMMESQYFETKKNNDIFLDILLRQQLKGEGLTDEEIRDEIKTFIFAGHNTSHAALSFCLYLLGSHKEIQEKAIEEQDEIFGNSDREPTMEDLKKMEYLERCIKEVLRLYPSIPLIAREATEDVQFGKHVIPKGVNFIITPFVTHRLPDQFPNPEEFNPDNFLQERVKQRHSFSYLSFSAGPRSCLGKTFALIAEKTVVSGILRQFRIDTIQTIEDLGIRCTTSLLCRNGIKIKLIPRNLPEPNIL